MNNLTLNNISAISPVLFESSLSQYNDTDIINISETSKGWNRAVVHALRNQEYSLFTLFTLFCTSMIAVSPENAEVLKTLNIFEIDQSLYGFKMERLEKMKTIFNFCLTFTADQLSTLQTSLANAPHLSAFSKIVQNCIAKTCQEFDLFLITSTFLSQKYRKTLPYAHLFQLHQFDAVMIDKKRAKVIKKCFSDYNCCGSLNIYLTTRKEEFEFKGEGAKAKALTFILKSRTSQGTDLLGYQQAVRLEEEQSIQPQLKKIASVRALLSENRFEEAKDIVKSLEAAEKQNKVLTEITFQQINNHLSNDEIDKALDVYDQANHYWNGAIIGLHSWNEVLVSIAQKAFSAKERELVLQAVTRIRLSLGLRAVPYNKFERLGDKNCIPSNLSIIFTSSITDTIRSDALKIMVRVLYQEMDLCKWIDCATDLEFSTHEFFIKFFDALELAEKNITIEADTLLAGLLDKNSIEKAVNRINSLKDNKLRKEKWIQFAKLLYPEEHFGLCFDFIEGIEKQQLRTQFLNHFFFNLASSRNSNHNITSFFRNVFRESDIKAFLQDIFHLKRSGPNRRHSLYRFALLLNPKIILEKFIDYACTMHTASKIEAFLTSLFMKSKSVNSFEAYKLSQMCIAGNDWEGIIQLPNKLERFVGLYILMNKALPLEINLEFIEAANEIDDLQERRLAIWGYVNLNQNSK